MCDWKRHIMSNHKSKKTREPIQHGSLVAKYQHSTTLMHLAKTPITDKDKHLLIDHPQNYVFGYNTSGRPDGFWVSKGSTWLGFATTLGNPDFPPCCYLYKVNTVAKAKILWIRSDADFKRFDRTFPSYWLNLDYFDIDFTDYLTSERVFAPASKKFVWANIDKKPGESVYDILLRNGLIFKTEKAAKAGCEFYKKTKIPLERLKYKDWGAIAKKYQGVFFDHYDQNNKLLMNYIWYQTLDAPSGCIWDASAVKSLDLMYYKREANIWREA